jgi:hypothetical protein
MLSGFFMFVLSMITLAVGSHLLPDRDGVDRTALVWKSWLEPLRGKAWRGLGDYRVVALLLLVTMIGLYCSFAGRESYYPVACRVTRAEGGQPLVGARVSLECDQGRWNFSAQTDAEGRCAYGTPSLAGGAPAGTVYRVKIDPPPGTQIPARYRSFYTSGLRLAVALAANAFELRVER